VKVVLTNRTRCQRVRRPGGREEETPYSPEVRIEDCRRDGYMVCRFRQVLSHNSHSFIIVRRWPAGGVCAKNLIRATCRKNTALKQRAAVAMERCKAWQECSPRTEFSAASTARQRPHVATRRTKKPHSQPACAKAMGSRKKIRWRCTA